MRFDKPAAFQIQSIAYKSHYENVPFEIPENWCWTTLGEVGKWQSGATPSRLCKEYYGGDIPWLKTGDLNDGYITDIPEYITQKALKETSVKLNPAGSVLLAMYGATIGKVGILTFPATTNQACCACVEYEATDQQYLFYFLLSHKENFIRQGGGGAQPNISKEKIVETLLPLPPFNEQKRIVNEVEKWFSIIDKIESGTIELESYVKQTKSKILDLAISGKLVPQDPDDEPAIELLKRINPAFKPCDNSHYGNLPFEVPDGWCWAKINDVTEFIKNGAPIKQFKGASGIPITRIETISNSELDMARMGYANITNGAEYKDYYIKDGDILMSHINSRAHIGKCALCNVGENQIIHGMNLLRIRCSKQILPEYMVYYFRSTTFYNLIEPHIKNAVNQASINITNLQKILIPIPPYSEQRRVAFIVDKLFSTIDTMSLSNK